MNNNDKTWAWGLGPRSWSGNWHVEYAFSMTICMEEANLCLLQCHLKEVESWVCISSWTLCTLACWYPGRQIWHHIISCMWMPPNPCTVPMKEDFYLEMQRLWGRLREHIWWRHAMCNPRSFVFVAFRNCIKSQTLSMKPLQNWAVFPFPPLCIFDLYCSYFSIHSFHFGLSFTTVRVSLLGLWASLEIKLISSLPRISPSSSWNDVNKSRSTASTVLLMTYLALL